MTLAGVSAPPLPRAYSARTAKWQRFQTSVAKPSQRVATADSDGRHPYMQQYSHVYYQRLAALRPRCWASVDRAATDARRVERILDLAEGVHSVVVGTVVREPGDDPAPLHPDSRCRAGDALFLEDESGRVKLRVADRHGFPTGVVLAAEGAVRADGVMEVDRLHTPELPPLVPAAPAADADAAAPTDAGAAAPPPCLLLLSGLQCGDPAVSSLPRDLLLSFLEGRFGPARTKAASVSRVILAGGLAGADPVAVRDLDGFCLAVASAGVPLDLLPGAEDPTTANWPQRPLHRALLPATERHVGRLVGRAPNPYAALLQGDRYVVGTDGANVRDLCRSVLRKAPAPTAEAMTDDEAAEKPQYAPISQLEALRRTLVWGHLCPTGPDSVPTAPHAAQDPMVLDDAARPALYFCGGADRFATALCHGTRLVCVPRFSATGEAVLVNLETLAVELLRFEE